MAMLSPLVLGKVEGGKLIADDPALLQKAFRCHEGKRVEFQVKRWYKRRTDPQNKYYWSVIVDMAADVMGEDDAEEAHENLKAECNYEMRTVGKGSDRQEYKKVLSTAKLNTAQFEEYCERCRRFLAKIFGIYVPLPNEVAT